MFHFLNSQTARTLMFEVKAIHYEISSTKCNLIILLVIVAALLITDSA